MECLAQTISSPWADLDISGRRLRHEKTCGSGIHNGTGGNRVDQLGSGLPPAETVRGQNGYVPLSLKSSGVSASGPHPSPYRVYFPETKPLVQGPAGGRSGEPHRFRPYLSKFCQRSLHQREPNPPSPLGWMNQKVPDPAMTSIGNSSNESERNTPLPSGETPGREGVEEKINFPRLA